ncbi:hypothetical protein ACRFB9_28500, partial [Klebsiella pneumoniae]
VFGFYRGKEKKKGGEGGGLMEWVSKVVIEKGEECWAILDKESEVLEKGMDLIWGFVCREVDNGNKEFRKV